MHIRLHFLTRSPPGGYALNTAPLACPTEVAPGRYLHQLLRCELRLICSILSQPMKSSENCRQLTAEEVALAEAAVTNEQGSPLSYGCLLPAVGGGEREGSEDE
jgi:hypothetical protein